ncbi:Six-hairpin glycosidase-like protein [Talaromyces proteolyticus]|uniref:Six-hairpin glycosidase-like protein n=1 Tax=Talaromyces proteolyticus TaxID=1131652 RepID=A0AAD4KFU8_9EURO|nr:Six-hairpin glycosidase-like protein [Talaromyces proteolyticus]KAH8690158.1 Six-hairpin glycosidase-like protein [Talaromyces proteolyticus]
MGYPSIGDYGLIGDMHTCALISKYGSIDFMCWPVFDSPSIFCRLLDMKKGGYFSITPASESKAISKQRYLPYTNMLETKWIDDEGVVDICDYFLVSKSRPPSGPESGIVSGWCPCKESKHDRREDSIRHSCLIRRMTCERGSMDLTARIFPAFNYARGKHQMINCPSSECINGRQIRTMIFKSNTETMVLDIFIDSSSDDKYGFPVLQLEAKQGVDFKGQGIDAKITISYKQSITFIVRGDRTAIPQIENIPAYIGQVEYETFSFWKSWAKKCTFTGHYREQVLRSLLVLKLLTYRPTGAIIASPTFSLPETVGGNRNWDYRYSWIRDTSFALYVLLENGYSEEAEEYMGFIYDRIIPSVTRRAVESPSKQSLPVVLTIRGECDIPEMELDHLEGYRCSRPVRIGNGATSHIQIDTFGALLDSIYLYNKFSGPISFDHWVEIRRVVNQAISLRHESDMSIWEVRGAKQNFVYSKIMLWVAVDRGLRLSEKRSNLPCPDRPMWIAVRDGLYEEIMEKGFNSELGFFCLSYENQEVLDASLLIAPLVLFLAADDPRFLSTLDNIMRTPEAGGLTSANLVFRYDHKKANDGVGGREGTFIMVTFWLIEAMSRVTKRNIQDHPNLMKLRDNAFSYFDNVMAFSNHLGMFSEEVDIAGEQVGNIPQAFSHLACVSAAMNLKE